MDYSQKQVRHTASIACRLRDLETRISYLENGELLKDERLIEKLQERYEDLAKPSFARTKTLLSHARKLKEDVDELERKFTILDYET